ncbi:hypothetical protein VNI00_011559 [Paramarasmius palmivorus]|uniref:Photolyase/cryptochrome alpha/beta domain-containing protein n=1 Tax=Paramarasmius palmivorus TaxID=297713 RepID=A0AAW0CDM6_9AGAR
MRSEARVLYWFRTDLRLHSNPALHAALKLEPEVLYPIWTWDPEYVYAHRVGVNRFNFLLESMRDLSRSLEACNPNTKLHVVRGRPQAVIPALIKEWRISHLVYEKDTSGYSLMRDTEIKRVVSEAGVKVIDVLGHTLYDPEEVIKSNGGRATLSLSSWRSAVKKLPEPSRPLPAPKSLPPPGDTDATNLRVPKTSREEHTNSDFDMNAETRVGQVTCYDSIAGPSHNFEIPTMEELGLPEATTSIRGGEKEALRRLQEFCENKEQVALFAKPKTSPAEFDPPATTLLSPYLKFGCLGVHEFLWRVRDTISDWRESSKKTSKATKEPENLEGQLAFREMYYSAEFAQGPEFGQIRGNSICRYIDWKLQNQYDAEGKLIVPRPRGETGAEEWYLAWVWSRNQGETRTNPLTMQNRKKGGPVSLG